MATKEEVKAAFKEVLVEGTNFVDGNGIFITPDVGRVYFRLTDQVIWVSGPAKTKARSDWVKNDGTDLGAVSTYEPGPVGQSGGDHPPAGVDGFWIEHAGGKGVLTLQIFSRSLDE